MSRLPQLRFDERLQLMRMDQDVLARVDVPVEQAHGTYAVPGFAADNARSTALSLAETVELLVRGAREGANLQRRLPPSTML